MKIEQTFDDYVAQAKSEFSATILKYFPHEMGNQSADKEMYLAIRVACEDILICLDNCMNEIGKLKQTTI